MANEKSILQKLKSKAKSKGLPFQLVLQLFCQEEFLRRLSESNFKDQLILKGGLFLFSYSDFKSRPTMDIDFLAQNMSYDKDEMINVISEICNLKTENDYIKFSIKSAEVISKMKVYQGVRVKLVASITNTKTPFDVDIGVGDVIVPKISELIMPTQLAGFESPKVASYSLESTIAEKLEAMFVRMEASSRMKDYFDIYYLASHYDFNGHDLREAILQTFTKRGTNCNIASLDRIAGMYMDQNMTKRWIAFTTKSLALSLEFQFVIDLIINFVGPIIDSIGKGHIFSKRWCARSSSYID